MGGQIGQVRLGGEYNGTGRSKSFFVYDKCIWKGIAKFFARAYTLTLMVCILESSSDLMFNQYSDLMNFGLDGSDSQATI